MALDLATELGFQAEDAGPLANAKALEEMVKVWLALAKVHGRAVGFAVSPGSRRGRRAWTGIVHDPRRSAGDALGLRASRSERRRSWVSRRPGSAAHRSCDRSGPALHATCGGSVALAVQPQTAARAPQPRTRIPPSTTRFAATDPTVELAGNACG